jgi:hypothetical protein
MKKPSRTERRQAARDAAKLVRAREKLAALEPGGAPDRPIEVSSASSVEPHAASLPCAQCSEHRMRVESHDALTTEDGRRLRRVQTRCGRCGALRVLYFRLGTAMLS